MIEKYPSELLQNAVEAIGSLPGVGSRSALRLAMHLLGQPKENVHHFTEAINRLADEVQYCPECMMISDHGLCTICGDRTRDHRTICVVENIRDVMSIENTGQYRGVYHVLGGIISPIAGIGPSDLTIRQLVDRLRRLSGIESSGEQGLKICATLGIIRGGDPLLAMEGVLRSRTIFRPLLSRER